MFVQVNEARSRTVDITSSVPQGSKIGLLLFITAIKDLQTVNIVPIDNCPCTPTTSA